jgi:hypothetical protein
MTLKSKDVISVEIHSLFATIVTNRATLQDSFLGLKLKRIYFISPNVGLTWNREWEKSTGGPRNNMQSFYLLFRIFGAFLKTLSKVHKSKGRTLFVVYVKSSKNKLDRSSNKIHLFTFIYCFLSNPAVQ